LTSRIMPATLSRTKRTVSLLVLGLIVMASATQTEVANVSSKASQEGTIRQTHSVFFP
jgi:hypothetical protein